MEKQKKEEQRLLAVVSKWENVDRSKAAAALKAVEGLDGLEMDGKKIYCARAQVRYVISAVLLSVCLWTWSWSWSWITTPHDTTHDTTRLGVVSWMV